MPGGGRLETMPATGTDPTREEIWKRFQGANRPAAVLSVRLMARPSWQQRIPTCRADEHFFREFLKDGCHHVVKLLGLLAHLVLDLVNFIVFSLNNEVLLLHHGICGKLRRLWKSAKGIATG